MYRKRREKERKKDQIRVVDFCSRHEHKKRNLFQKLFRPERTTKFFEFAFEIGRMADAKLTPFVVKMKGP